MAVSDVIVAVVRWRERVACRNPVFAEGTRASDSRPCHACAFDSSEADSLSAAVLFFSAQNDTDTDAGEGVVVVVLVLEATAADFDDDATALALLVAIIDLDQISINQNMNIL